MDYFSHILGQEPVLGMLQKTLQEDKLSHAYLFWGSPGVGKKTTAEAWARAILRLPEENPGQMPQHPDLLLIQPKEGEKSIGKNLIVKELIPWLGIRPYRARVKLVLIYEAERLTTEAANALLKILEEPPHYAVIVLITDQTVLLPTIVSRCQSVRFAPLGEATLTRILCRQGLDEAQARKFSAISGGNARWALQFTPADLEEKWQQARQILQQLASGQRSAIFAAATVLEKKPAVLSILLILLRDAYIYQQTGDQSLLLLSGLDEKPGTLRFAPGFTKNWREVQILTGYETGNVNKLMLYINICFKLQHMLSAELA